MTRHPLLRAAQAVLASAAGALVAAQAVEAAHRPAAVSFTVAVVGECERPDGSWEGVDLLRQPARMVNRFQLTLTPDTDARALVEAQAADGSWERLYLGTLAGHRDYALPAPHSFFGVQGDVRVRVTLSRVRAPATEPAAALAGPVEPGPPLPLSDGAPFRLGRARFSSDRAALLELSLHGR